MSDQIDNMLKEMEEFNKKYGLSTAGLSSPKAEICPITVNFK